MNLYQSGMIVKYLCFLTKRHTTCCAPTLLNEQSKKGNGRLLIPLDGY